MKKHIFILSSALLLSFSTMAQFQVNKLPYSYSALEPYIDSATMFIHYNFHHTAFANNLNRILADYPDWKSKSDVFILQNINLLPADIQTAVRNNAGGFYNHNLFWDILAPAGTAPISAKMKEVIVQNFGSFEAFQAEFNRFSSSVFGSGWVWLMKNDKGKLYIASTPNQDNPLINALCQSDTPILALDVWEHAYYLEYQNRRGEYIDAFWHVVNWKKVEELYFKKN
ncbi:MAG: superoxide dismutase [Bacteroidales bacterium]|nr:superoxide dismutase [Bacteroidales bacterium]